MKIKLTQFVLSKRINSDIIICDHSEVWFHADSSLYKCATLSGRVGWEISDGLGNWMKYNFVFYQKKHKDPETGPFN